MFLEFPFDHAVQINYNANNQETSRSTVTSGNVKFGYEKRTGTYPEMYMTEVPHYAVELYFRIPADAYKYTYGYKGFWYNGSLGVDFKDTYQHYYYYSDYRWSTTQHGTEVTSGELSFNSAYDRPYADPKFKPGDRTIYESRLANIHFSESDVNVIQRDGIEYLYIKIFPVVNLLKEDPTNYFYGSTELHTFSVDNIVFGMDAMNISLNVEPVYPVNVYVRDDRDLIVDWNFSNSVNRSETYLYQVSNEVVITDKNGDSITASVSGSTESQVTFDAEDLDTLAIGRCTVSITVTSNYGTTGTATCEFELTGETDAPEITSVTQNSYPTITWTSENQTAWELQISNADGIVYKTGMVAGDDTSYTVPRLLEDGGYSLEMRCLNEYGIVSAWSSYFLELSPTKPDAPTNIVVSARADFGISINCDAMETTGKLLAVRKKDSDSEPEVLGEYNGSFIDYLVGLEDPHEYTIRNYVEGYADGDWIDGVLAYKGVVIRDANDYSKYVHVWMSEAETINYLNDDERTRALARCVGRTFPVSELGEWLTVERSFTGYVSKEEFKKLQKMSLNSTHVLLQANEEYFPCDMTTSDQGEYSNGRIVNFKMTRIDGDK